MYTYKTSGTCSKSIRFEVENGVITQCAFERGCAGNTQGIARLIIGQRVDDVIERLQGIQCQNGTSCPDQLANALLQWKTEQSAS